MNHMTPPACEESESQDREIKHRGNLEEDGGLSAVANDEGPSDTAPPSICTSGPHDVAIGDSRFLL